MNHRSDDNKLQKIQKALTASSSLLLRAASELSQYLQTSEKANVINLDLKVAITLLKDSFLLMVKVNLFLNHFGRQLVKSSLLGKLA